MDRKRRRTGADTNAFSHADCNCNTDHDAFSHTDDDSTSDSSRTAASDTRTSPDTLSSVAASPTGILAREGNSATGAVLNHVHTVLLNRLASGPHLGSDRSVTFYCSG